MRHRWPSVIEKILAQAPEGSGAPFERLERGKSLIKGKETIAQSGLPALVQGALYLYIDAFEEAHDAANAHEGTPAGNWIHAILHRREPDAGNSKYWYARVSLPGETSRALVEEVLQLGELQELKGLESFHKRIKASKEWEPSAFVDACEMTRKQKATPHPALSLKGRGDGEAEAGVYQTLARIQQIEWRALLGFVLG